jgi:hypothetical protein
MMAMDAREFVSNLRLAVEQTATRSILSTLESPPGRRPEARVVQLSKWFNDLTLPDREMLAKTLALAAEQTTYNMLLVLDGSLAIESARDKGQLELFYVDAEGRTRLNDPDSEELTVLFKDAVGGDGA